ncbi:MAG: GHMP kinase [Myxococcales bacterium]|nr:GHMP kinase [Myxococcales bacterium]
MIIRGKAPLRASFCGGGSDVSPYCDQHGGCVLSTTIQMYIYGALEVRDDREVAIYSLDYDQLVQYDLDSEIREGDHLRFLKAVIARLDPPRGFNLYMHSDAPPGTGLGSSGAASALTVGLVNHAFNMMMSRYDIAQTAYEVEHDDLGASVGRQDHYAATFGGFNFIEFSADGTLVIPLRVERWILEELEYHIQLFYTKKKRDSSDLVAQQIGFYKEKREETLSALDRMKDLTRQMHRALLTGRLRRFGELLHESFQQKKQMNPLAIGSYLDEIYDAARLEGALGGKILGAGGGGYFLFFTPFMRKKAVSQALQRLGAQPVPINLDFEGLRTWEVRGLTLRDESDGMFGK